MNAKTIRLLALFLALAAPALAAPGDTLADRVLGQRRLTTSSTFLIDGRVFSAPDLAVDRSSTPNRIYVADADLNRVLGWSDVARFRAGQPADLVLGQPSLVTGIYLDDPREECPEIPGPAGFCRPTRVAVDARGNVYVVDSFNYRVLEFDRPFATDRIADRVFGQSDFNSRERPETTGPDLGSEVFDVAVDGGGNLWMTAMDGSRRVLELDDPLTHDAQPDRVLEPAPPELCSGRPAPKQRFCVPYEIALNPQGDLYVRDYASYNQEGDRGWTHVYLQPLTTDLKVDFRLPPGLAGMGFDAAGDLYFVSSASLQRYRAPLGASSQPEVLFEGGELSGRLDFDAAGNLYMAQYIVSSYEYNLNFVYVFAPPYQSQPARVGRVKTAAEGLWHPYEVAIDRSVRPNRLYALDTYNRVLGWRDVEGLANGAPPDLILNGNGPGLLSGDFCVSLFALVDASHFCVDNSSVQGGLAVDSRGNLWLSDVDNHRVLEFDRPFETDGVADRVLGQKGSFTSHDCNKGGISASSLCFPGTLAFDGADNLYVADLHNHRVLLFLDPLKDSIADKVFGQRGFRGGECNGGGNPGAATLCLGREEWDVNSLNVYGSSGLAVDSTGTLYVSDRENARVLAFRDALHSNGRADAVLGQDGRFGTRLTGTGPRRFGDPRGDDLASPAGLAIGPGGDLYVADATNDRVLVFRDPLRDDRAGRVFGHTSLDEGGIDRPDSEYYGNVPPPSAARLLQPTGLAFDSLGNLWVADRNYNRILRFDHP